jgi:hypothetical protein
MNVPTKGQVYFLTVPAALETKKFKTGEYEVLASGAIYAAYPNDKMVRIAPNRIGAANTFTIYENEWSKYLPILRPDVEAKAHLLPKTKRNTKIEIVEGALGMAKRYYNAKRIIEEPCRVEVVPTKDFPRITVKWLRDGVFDNVGTITVYDPKWLPKHLAELETQIAYIQGQKAYVQSVIAEIGA